MNYCSPILAPGKNRCRQTAAGAGKAISESDNTNLHEKQRVVNKRKSGAGKGRRRFSNIEAI